jgi:hypothetical protein
MSLPFNVHFSVSLQAFSMPDTFEVLALPEADARLFETDAQAEHDFLAFLKSIEDLAMQQVPCPLRALRCALESN